MVTLSFPELIGVAVALAGAVAWLVALQWRQKSHEDLCSERYKQIAANSAQLVKVSDERHAENKDRLEGIDTRLWNLDEKIDLVLARLR